MIVLHGMSSPNVRKVVIALEEMALAYQPRHVAVFRGAQYADEFRALNPMAKAPVLVDPDGPAAGEPLFESGAILLYLAEAHGPDFLPAAGPARYATLKWLFWQMANLGPALGNHSHFRFRHAEEPYAAGRFRRMATQCYRVLEARLGEAEWLGGAAYSIADMAVYPWAHYLERHGEDAAAFPRTLAWRARIAARPAVKRAGEVIRRYAAIDLADRAAATPDERDRLLGLHLPAPSAEAAARNTENAHVRT